METLEKTLDREVNDLNKQIEQLENLGRIIANLEKSYKDESWSAAASDSKTHIQCIVDRITEFARSRRFYQLGEAIDDAITQIEDHQRKFPREMLGGNVFTSIRDGLNARKYHFETVRDTVENLKGIAKFNERTNKHQLKIWAESLERLGEELEDNLEIFPSNFFDVLESFCEIIISKARKKPANERVGTENRKEEWRRRVRYAAGFILNLIEIAREEAIQEEEEIIHDFFAASQLSFGDVWEDEGEHCDTI